MKIIKKIFYGFLYFLLIIFITIGVRILLFEIYYIKSNSMEDTISPNDRIFLSKLNYGPRMPASPFEIPWINIFYYLNKNYRTKTDSVW